MVSRSPSSTRPGWVRQVNGVGDGISVGDAGVDVLIVLGGGVAGIAVGAGRGCSDGEQAESPARSESSIVIRIIA